MLATPNKISLTFGTQKRAKLVLTSQFVFYLSLAFKEKKMFGRFDCATGTVRITYYVLGEKVLI